MNNILIPFPDKNNFKFFMENNIDGFIIGIEGYSETFNHLVKMSELNDICKMLKEKDKKIHQEIERLKRLRSLLKNTMNITLDSFNVEIDKITFTHKEEEYFIVTEGTKTPDDKAVFSAISQHVNYCNKHNFYYTFSLGEIISAEHIQDKTFQTTYFCTKINRKVNNKQLLIKPAGLYAIKYIRGSYDDLIKAYAQFVEELHNMNYNVIGALYEEDMLNYLSETDFNYYLMRIEARIL